MGNVDEDPWVAECPRCHDTATANQCPVSFDMPCPHCGLPLLDKGHKNLLLFYHCQACGQRYLTPKLDPDDDLLELFKPP